MMSSRYCQSNNLVIHSNKKATKNVSINTQKNIFKNKNSHFSKLSNSSQSNNIIPNKKLINNKLITPIENKKFSSLNPILFHPEIFANRQQDNQIEFQSNNGMENQRNASEINSNLKERSQQQNPLKVYDEAVKEMGNLDSFVSFRDINVGNILELKKVNSIFQPLQTVNQDQTVFEAISIMNSKNIGALLVTKSKLEENEEDQGKITIEGKPELKNPLNPLSSEIPKKIKKPETGEYLAGIISERDYLSKIILKGLTSKNTPIKDIMTKRLIVVTPETSAGECMSIITNKRIRHLPVIDMKGYCIGVVSIGDLVKYILVEQRQTIDFLKEYVERTY